MNREPNTVRVRDATLEDGLVFELDGDTASMDALLDALDGRYVEYDTLDDGTPDGYGATVWSTSRDATRDELAQHCRNAAALGRVDLLILPGSSS